MFKQNQKAFTLVELIVVVTILAILWTIAFISLQWYSRSSRDSVRISDVGNIKTSLELFVLESGRYPLPDNYEEISYSGDTLWYQWNFWENTISQLWGKLNKVPLDPLTEKKYIYSVANNKNEFEILILLEDSLVNTLDVSPVIAANVAVIPKIVWTYNWVFIKTNNFFIPLPSIINSEVNWAELLLNNINIKSQIISWWENTPNLWNFTFNTWSLAWLELSVYTWSLEKNLSDVEKIKILKALKESYKSDSWAPKSTYDDIIMETSYPNLIAYVDSNIIKNKIKSSVTQWNDLDTNCNNDDILIWDQIWAWCNSTLWNGFEFWQTDPNIWTDLYVWAVMLCFKDYIWIINNIPDCVIWDVSMSSNTKANNWFNWYNVNGDSEFDNIWWKFYTWDNAALACPSWRDLPSFSYFEIAETFLNGWDTCVPIDSESTCEWLWWMWHNQKNSSNNLANALEVTLWGMRLTPSFFWLRGASTVLWSSSEMDIDNVNVISFIPSLTAVWHLVYSKALWASVRCIKN